MAEREIVLLSGMHRSGTSALARVFALLGARLPEPLVPPSLGNEHGHWEPAEAVAMNDAALLAAGGDVNSLHPLSPDWVEGGGGEGFVDELCAWLERVAPPGALTVVKDPRIALLAPFWRAAVERLGVRPRFVVSWRDPWEVSRSLATRQLAHFPDEVWPHERVELLWLRHQLELERASRGALRSFVAYASLLDDWRPVMSRVFAELELDAPEMTPSACAEVDAFLRPEARRQRRPQDAGAPSREAAEVQRLLEARVGRPDGGAADFDKAAGRFEGAVALLGGYVAALEARVAADAPGGEAGDVRTLVAALRETAQAAELRAVERVRGEAPPAEPPEDATDERLHVRHEGLRLAHARLVEDSRAAQVAAEGRLAALRRDHGRDVARLEAAATRAREARDAELARWEAESRRKQDAHAGALHAAERRLQRESERASSAEGELDRARAQLVELRAEAGRLRGEIEDHRAAYESLRLEALDGRTSVAAGGRERDDVRDCLREAQAQARALQREGETAAADIQAARGEAAALRSEVSDLRAQAAALQASASWRVTRPMRSVTFRLRRLVRR